MPLGKSNVFDLKNIWPQRSGHSLRVEEGNSMRGVARGWTMFLLSAVWLSAYRAGHGR